MYMLTYYQTLCCMDKVSPFPLKANFVAMRIPQDAIMRGNMMLRKQHMPSSEQMQHNGILTALAVKTLKH